MDILTQLARLPAGYSTGAYAGRRYGISKSAFNDGRSIKIYAEELGGTDFISLNYYATQAGGRLRPCEMPVEKVLRFLEEVVVEM